MTRINDSSGTSWALMQVKDSVGRIYIRAYRNAWDPIKKRSYLQAKVQVGRLQENGSIKLSKGFIERFPDYAEGDWYWGDRELVSEAEFRATFGSSQAAADISWSSETIQVGVTYAAWTQAADSGLLEDLTAEFGAEDARMILALAIYKLDGGGAMMNFEDWVPLVWLPNIKPVDGRRISELLNKISPAKIDAFFKRRYKRATVRTPGALTLSMDSTSISTYSSTIRDAAWGHAKQNPELRQVNYMAVCDHENGDIVYATSYDGSINDKAILPTIYARMQNAGIDLAQNILVTDRGFSSIYNSQISINMDIRYLQFMQVNQQGTQHQFRRKMKLLTDPVAACLPRFDNLSACTVEDVWKQSTDAGSVTVKAQLHLYRNHLIAESQIASLYSDVNQVLELKNEQADRVRALKKDHRAAMQALNTQFEDEAKRAQAGAKLINELERKIKQIYFVNPVDDELRRRTGRLLKTVTDNDDVKVWVIDYNALSKAVEFAGCQAIRTNVDGMSASEAMTIYRRRQIIEQGFDQLKNEVGGSRFEATETAYRGKLFLYTLAQSIRMRMIYTAHKKTEKDPTMSVPGDSVSKVLCQLRGLQARLNGKTSAFVPGTVAKRHRDALSLIGIEKLPKTFFRN